VEYDAR